MTPDRGGLRRKEHGHACWVHDFDGQSRSTFGDGQMNTVAAGLVAARVFKILGFSPFFFQR